MTVRLRPGEQLVRLEAISPAHLGAAEGGAALDRPTQKDALTELPYVPDSALKGVLASRFGNPSDEEPNAGREAIFGAPDRAGSPGRPRRPGRPGALVAGNGEMLCFPLPARDGLPVRCFPALAVARFLRRAPAGDDVAAASDLLRWIEQESASLPGRACRRSSRRPRSRRSPAPRWSATARRSPPSCAASPARTFPPRRAWWWRRPPPPAACGASLPSAGL